MSPDLRPASCAGESSNTFAALPELGVNLSLALTDRVRVQTGYSAIWINDIVRTAEMIDRRVNPTQLSGGALIGDPHPARLPNEADLWMQGFSLMVLIES